jgi:HTH-like domain
MVINRSTMTYRSRRDPRDALRRRLHQLAASRVRFGYRRLTVLLRRQGWIVNAKRICRLYTEDGLAVRTKVRKKIEPCTSANASRHSTQRKVEHGLRCGPAP